MDKWTIIISATSTAVALIGSYLLNRRKTGAEVESIKASTDDRRFDTLKKEISHLSDAIREARKRNEELQAERNEVESRLNDEVDKERKSCAEIMLDMGTQWELKLKALNKRISELEQQLKK